MKISKSAHQIGSHIFIGLALTFALLTTACDVALQDKKDSDQNQQNDPVQLADPTPDSQVSPEIQQEPSLQYLPSTMKLSQVLKVTVQPESEVKFYEIVLNWIPMAGNLRIRKNQSLVGFAVGSAGEFKLLRIPSGSNDEFSIEYLDEEEHTLDIMPINPMIPVYVILEDWELTKDETVQAHRIMIKSGAVITTLSHKLTLIADEFFSENGLIQNFTSAAVGNVLQPGRHGGDIHLQLKKAQGSLKVVLSGEKGGPGNSINHYHLTEDGKFGFLPLCIPGAGAAGGNAGSLKSTYLEGNLKLDFENSPGKGGEVGTYFKDPKNPMKFSSPENPCSMSGPPRNKGPDGSPGKVCESYLGLEERCSQ